MPQHETRALWKRLAAVGDLQRRFLGDATRTVHLAELEHSSIISEEREALRGRSVLLAVKGQLDAAFALIELDGIARRIVLCPPDLLAEHQAAIARTADVELVISTARPSLVGTKPRARAEDERTEWILLTSGTTGIPKLVVHDLSSLAGPARPRLDAIWSTFYDIRRYGGLAIFFRALLGGGSLVLSDAGEETNSFLKRVTARAVTHISGTPSHWRRALMSPAASDFAPRYVRLSGEIADQSILDRLHAFWPDAALVHAFASTEAGLAFEVNDRLAGFPAKILERGDDDVRLKIVEGSLRIRSSRTASGYLGEAGSALAGADGFVDTHDLLERRGERFHFVGRSDGVINVGGVKTHPEEVEAIINAHPGVRMSLVKARSSPFTGAVTVADIVPSGNDAPAILADEILALCRRHLPPHKVPVSLNFVDQLPVSANGKLRRHHA